jgi:Fe-S-cluster containining protein
VARPAGELAAWLEEIEAARHGEQGMDVPCDGCTACCRSRQFVHIEPDEIDTVARIPPQLLAQAPGLPHGNLLLGYDQRGHCPMLVDDRCSIYDHRPRACRVYDCRVYAAAGVEPDDDKPEIAERVAEWQFSHSNSASSVAQAAIRAAAAFLRAEPDAFPRGAVNSKQIALAAIALRDLFDGDRPPQVEHVQVRLSATRR